MFCRSWGLYSCGKAYFLFFCCWWTYRYEDVFIWLDWQSQPTDRPTDLVIWHSSICCSVTSLLWKGQIKVVVQSRIWSNTVLTNQWKALKHLRDLLQLQSNCHSWRNSSFFSFKQGNQSIDRSMKFIFTLDNVTQFNEIDFTFYSLSLNTILAWITLASTPKHRYNCHVYKHE